MLLKLEDTKKGILLKQEELWRLKSRAIWIKSGNKNTKFTKGRNMRNTIWTLNDLEGGITFSFKELSNLGKRNFKNLYKDPLEASIVEVTQMAWAFPYFTNDEDNQNIMEPIPKVDL